jgi:hypothetical protein
MLVFLGQGCDTPDDVERVRKAFVQQSDERGVVLGIDAGNELVERVLRQKDDQTGD